LILPDGSFHSRYVGREHDGVFVMPIAATGRVEMTLIWCPPDGGGELPFEEVDINVDKDINVDVDVFQSFFTDVTLVKFVDIDIDVDVNVDIEGNFAQATWDVQAIGEDTAAEIDLVVLAIEETLSHVSGTAYAAVDEV
jgi:hypothetical protein